MLMSPYILCKISSFLTSHCSKNIRCIGLKFSEKGSCSTSFHYPEVAFLRVIIKEIAVIRKCKISGGKSVNESIHSL